MANLEESISNLFGLTSGSQDIDNYMKRNQYSGFVRGAGLNFADPYKISDTTVSNDPIMKYITKTGGQAGNAARNNASAKFAGTGFGDSSFANAYADNAYNAAISPYTSASYNQLNTMGNRSFEADKIGLALDQFIAQLAENARQSNAGIYSNSKTGNTKPGGGLNVLDSVSGILDSFVNSGSKNKTSGNSNISDGSDIVSGIGALGTILSFFA